MLFRSDPSYLPALEQHIAGLRADRETARAMDAAGYVLASLSAEIDAFTAVAEAMHRKLSRMDPAQRKAAMKAIREAEWWGDPVPRVRVSPHETRGQAR